MEPPPAWLGQMAQDIKDLPTGGDTGDIVLPLATYRKLRTVLEGMVAYVAVQLEKCQVDDEESP